MAGRYDLTPIDDSTLQKMLNNYGSVANNIFSQEEMDQLLARYGAMEDQGLNQAYNAALMDVSRQFSPAYDAIRARNYGLYAGGGAARDYSKVTGDLMGQLAGQRMGLGAESSSRKAALLRALAQQRISGRQALGEQMYGRMLTAKKKPSLGAQLVSGGLQLAGGVVGAKLGAPEQPAPAPTGYGQFGPPQTEDWRDYQNTYAPTYRNPTTFMRRRAF